MRAYLILAAALVAPAIAYALLVTWLSRSRALKDGLADFPTTQFRILFTVALAGGTGLAVFYCFVQAIKVDPDILEPWLLFLFGMAGLDVAQWGVKRGTAWKPGQGGPTPSEGGALAPASVAAATSGQPARVSGQLQLVPALAPAGAGAVALGAERYGDERDGGVD